MTKKKVSAFWPKNAELDFQNCDVLKIFMSEVSLNMISHNAEIARYPNLIHFRIITENKHPIFWEKIFVKSFKPWVSPQTKSHIAEIDKKTKRNRVNQSFL